MFLFGLENSKYQGTKRWVVSRTTRIPGRQTPVSRKNFTGADELILLYLQFQFIF